MKATKCLVLALVLLAPAAVFACSDLLDAEFRPLAGSDRSSLCSHFEGKVLLVVNTASKCGFTPQYEGLEALHQKYAQRGFAVLGFPSNDFMGQEPGTETEIQEFCALTYGVKFPMFEKVTVKKGTAVAFYDQLAAQAGGEYPGWNFHKYLIDRNGRVIRSFGSRVKPDDAALIEAIENSLATPSEASGAR